MIGKSEIAKPAAFTRSMSRLRKFTLLTLVACASANPYKPIVDPTRDDHELTKWLCGPSDPTPNTSTSCGPPNRQCVIDDVFSHDADVNATCAPEGCHVCLHKELLPFAPTDYAGTALLFLGGVMAGAAGIGGGGLNVPLLILVMGFVMEEAVPLSHVAVFGNSIAQNLVNLRRRHPLAPYRPMVDFDIPLLLLPAQLAGNSVGVLVGAIFPATVMVILACLLLLLASSKTLLTGVKAYRRERAAAVDVALGAATISDGFTDGASASSSNPSLLAAAPPLLSDVAVSSSAHSLAAAEEEAAAASAVFHEKRESGGSGGVGGMGAAAKVALLFGFFALFILDSFAQKLLGGKTCSTGYWAWRVALYAACAAAVGGGGWLALKTQGARARAGTPQLSGDITYTPKSLVATPLLAVGVGVVAGLLGLGGGELMAPLLLALGMLPQVASATSAFMIFFTSGANLVTYLAQGVLTPDPGYVVWIVTLGFCSAMVGRLSSVFITTRLRHPSFIVLTLGAILLVSMFLLIARVAQVEPQWAFSALCPTD